MNLSKIRQMVLDGDMSAQAVRYLIDCKGECEHLDYKENIDLSYDYGRASLGRDVVAMKNAGGGYIVVGVKDKTWEPVGLSTYNTLDTKLLRDAIRRATGLDLEADIVNHQMFVEGSLRYFSVILTRSTAKQNKLASPSVCAGDFNQKEKWGIRSGDIYFRKGDQTVRLSTQQELLDLLDDLREKQARSAIETEIQVPSPFAIENGLFRLLPREYEQFIGRTELKKQAVEAIERDPRIWIVNLYGPGGVGKSALASWLANYYYSEKRFDSILQLSAKNNQLSSKGILRLQPTLYSLENLLDSILLLFGFDEHVSSPLEERRDISITLLSDYSMLLVLDNMETVSDGRIMAFVKDLPPSVKTKVLLTSRLRTSGWEVPIRLDELEENEVREFVEIKGRELGIGTIPNFGSVVEKLRSASGGLPLAIQWMLGQFLLSGNWNEVTDKVRGSDSPLLEFSFRNSWERLPSQAQKALSVLSIFDEAPTSQLWATALDWTSEETEMAAEKLIEATFVSEKIDIKTGKKTYHSLPITMEFARNELAKMGNLEISARTNFQRFRQQMDLVAVETERFTYLFEEWGVERNTEKQAIILARKAESAMQAFNFEEAERLYTQAMDIDPRSVYVLVNYARLKQTLGQMGKAITLMETASKRMNKQNGFFVYYNFSRIYDDIRDRHKVVEYLRKALEYKPEHPVARHQLGVATSRLGHYDEAISIFDSLISDDLALPNGPTETLVYTYKTKIISLRKAKRFVEADRVYREAKNEVQKWPHLRSKAQELEDT